MPTPFPLQPVTRLGIDFDNTIVCYDALFHRVALEGGWIPADLPANKSDVRNHLRSIGREDVWTEMQGQVYGARMAEATPYPGALRFIWACRAAGIEVFIISHKTRTPFAGEPHDLHAAALDWLTRQGVFDPARLGLPRENVFFELTKAEKLGRIRATGCSHYIDDLPELLAEPSFPKDVDRVLFDPNRLYPDESRFRRLVRWLAAPRVLFGEPRFESANREKSWGIDPTSDMAQFLVRHGFPASPRCRIPFGGANNRVYHLHTADRDLLLKSYFYAETDPRDRFGTERAFYEFAWQQGIRCLPEPIAWDATHRFGLFEYVQGELLTPEELTRDCIDQAVAFVAELNTSRHLPAAQALPVGSEACFSLAEHVERIGRRVSRLAGLEPSSPIDHEGAAFIRTEVVPRWENLRADILEHAAARNDSALPADRRCLSPSDFGFHNALMQDDGWLRFIDFEYAGWDDPAKLVGDFFCQPRIPVDPTYWESVVSRLDTLLGWGGELATRAGLLLPAYRLKWCCIILNEFVRTDRARREFSQGHETAGEARKVEQLEKARRYLAPGL